MIEVSRRPLSGQKQTRVATQLSIARLNRMAADVIVPYSEQYAAAHAEFATRNWPQNELRRDAGYNRWKYRARNQDRIEGLLLAILDGQVVGQAGLTSVMLRHNGATFTAQWLSDYRVDPNHRLHGIGPLLVARAVSGGIPTLSDAPTSQSMPVLKAIGFRELKGPQRMHLPLASARVASRQLEGTILGKQPALIPIVATLAPIYLAWRSRRLRWGKNSPAVRKCGWGELADRISESQKTLTAPHVVHDSAFLSWRSAQFGDGLDGVHGLRAETGGYVLFGRHRFCLYVFDWAASTWEECRALFAAAQSAGKTLGADSLSVLVNTAQERQWLESLGFFGAQKPYALFFYSPQNFAYPLDHLHFCHIDAHANL